MGTSAVQSEPVDNFGVQLVFHPGWPLQQPGLPPSILQAMKSLTAAIKGPQTMELSSPFRLYLFGYLAAILGAVVVQGAHVPFGVCSG